ncbi:MAG: ATP-binding cassette domain-containing protein [Egibacteraceae bacterium]
MTLTVRRGEIAGLTGAGGSGKSTLARIAVGLVAPSGGTLRVGGVQVPALRGQAFTRPPPSRRVGPTGPVRVPAPGHACRRAAGHRPYPGGPRGHGTGRARARRP